MDKMEFAAVCIAGCTIIEGLAIVSGFDGALAVGMVGIFGAVAGSVLGFTYGQARTFIKEINTKQEEEK
jgi:hypothetical protein